MATTKTLRLDNDGTLKMRYFHGRSLYWGHNQDEIGANLSGSGEEKAVSALPGGSGVQQINIDLSNSRVDFQFPFMGRHLQEWDLSAWLPLNAVITSASLRLTFFFTAPSEDRFPMTIGIMRVLRVPDMVAADMQNYAPGNPWNTFGMLDLVDYKAHEASMVVTFSEADGSSSNSPLVRDLDVKGLVQFASDSDDRVLRILVSRTDAHRKSFPKLSILQGDSAIRLQYGDGTSSFKNPVLTIVYVDPLTTHPADDAGDIQDSVFVDTTEGNLHHFPPIAVGSQSAADKFFIKNQLSASALNLKILSQTSHGSMQHEIDYQGISVGKLSDIGTVDKSNEATNYTRTERWRVILDAGDAAAGEFHVYRDNGTHDDPTQTDTWSPANPATGTIGSQYTELDRGVSFTLSEDSPVLEDGDKAEFRTFEDDAQDQAPAGSDKLVAIAPDVNNTPGVFQILQIKRVLVSSAVAASQTVPVSDASRFSVGATVKFWGRTTGTEQTRTVDAVNTSTNEITVDTAITLAEDDYAEMVPLGTAELGAGQTFPFWLKAVSEAGISRKTYYPRWRAVSD